MEILTITDQPNYKFDLTKKAYQHLLKMKDVCTHNQWEGMKGLLLDYDNNMGGHGFNSIKAKVALDVFVQMTETEFKEGVSTLKNK